MSDAPARGPREPGHSPHRKGPQHIPAPAWGMALIALASVAVGWWTGQLRPAPAPQPSSEPVIASPSRTVQSRDRATPPAVRSPQQESPDTEPRITSSQRASDLPSEIEVTPSKNAAPATAPPETAPSDSHPAAPPAARPTLIRGVTLKNVNGDVIYRGDVDLQPTIDRIAAGGRNAHRNDGSTFSNREGRLPRRPSGYYREYVVPTPDLKGPGPQRLIRGQQGEFYYTADHYKTFRKIDVGKSQPVPSGRK